MKIFSKLQQKKNLLVAIFFLAYFLLGIFVYRDYGLSWDEQTSRMNGFMVYRYLKGESKELFSWRDRNYGTAFELPLVAAEVALRPDSSREIMLLRHFLTFSFFFLGALTFYFLAQQRFNDWKLALFGVIFLILSPRIFADSFYNSKDIALLVAMIFAIYTQVRFLKEASLKWGILHSTATAFLIDIRLTGLIIPVLTIIFFGLHSFIISEFRKGLKEKLGHLGIYLILLITQIILFWPYLWVTPLKNFLSAFSQMSRFIAAETEVFYFGQHIKDINLPWHYPYVWIGISTPIVYLGLFLTGILTLLSNMLENLKRSYQKYWPDLLFLAWFSVPLAAIYILHSVIYDGWRQLYFIYPALILIALRGLAYLFAFGKKIREKRGFRLIWIVIGLIVINLFWVVRFMIQNHPHQNLYFNVLVGGMQRAKENFELDYWGLTFRKGLEYIARTDDRQNIPILLAYGNAGEIDILEEKDAIRFIPLLPERAAEVDYVLSNYRWLKGKYPPELMKKEVFNVKIDGVTVMSVFKLKE
jgi:hypothetical protein